MDSHTDMHAVVGLLADGTRPRGAQPPTDQRVDGLWQLIWDRVGPSQELSRLYVEATAGRGVSRQTRHAAAQVLGAVAARDPAFGAAVAVAQPPTGRAPARRRSLRTRLLVIAGAVVLLAGIAAAAVWYLTPEDTPRPAPLLATGPELACGVGDALPPVCWWPDGGDQPMPEQEQSGDFHAIAVGAAAVCALRDDGEVYCWDPNTGLVEGGQAVPTPPTSDKYSAIVVGCGVRTGGALQCWDPAAPRPPDGAFVAIAAGQYGGLCAVRQSGVPVCWGTVAELTAAAPPSGVFVAVSVGGYHACGLRDDGSVACWGKNEEGQATAPQGRFTAVTAGEEHSCALRDDGTVACWGRDKGGQTTPPSGAFAVLGVSGGGEYTCATRPTGRVECWGGDGRIAAPDRTFRH